MLSFLRRLGVPQIEPAQLEERLRAGTIRLLDVREENEYRSGHVPGAVLVPLKRLPDRLDRLKRDKPYAVICASGDRSRTATSYLLGEGFEGTVSVAGGTTAWVRSGRAIVR